MIERLEWHKIGEYVVEAPDRVELCNKINEIVDLINEVFDIVNENRKTLNQIAEASKKVIGNPNETKTMEAIQEVK